MKLYQLLLLGIVIFGILPISSLADDDIMTLYFFYSTTCPHCKAEKAFLEEIEGECVHIKIEYLEFKENEELFEEMAKRYNTTTSAVPMTFLGDKAYVGFSEENGELEFNPVYKAYEGYRNVIYDHINHLRAELSNQTCAELPEDTDTGILADPSNSWIFLLIIIYGLSYLIVKKKLRSSNNAKKYWISGLIFIIIVSAFIFITSQSDVAIKDYAQSLPFPFFVTIIALADGFNPCAFTVLIILLSLLTYTKSRKDMSIVGMTFIITSAVMYFVFIMVMVLAGSWAFHKYGSMILLILGLVILGAGLINMKDFFFLGKGISLSISDKQKGTFTHKARDIVKRLRESDTGWNFFLALIGTILLAIFVNLVELGCTAILPAVYMASLVKSFGTSLAMGHIIWTAYYSVIYIIPLLVILIAFIYSFKSTRISEKHGRILKLASGLFMIFFGLLMIFWPELLVFG